MGVSENTGVPYFGVLIIPEESSVLLLRFELRGLGFGVWGLKFRVG